MKPLLLLPLLLVAASCQGDPDSTGTSETGDEVVTQEQLPTPYTAEQIRGGCMPGTQIVFRVKMPGNPTLHNYMRFTEDDGEKATVLSWAESTEGQPLGERTSQTMPWSELRDHALLPLGSTRERATVAVPQGTFDAWHYVESLDEADGGGERHYWFADKFPGPPVKLTHVVEGVEQMHMELIARALP